MKINATLLKNSEHPPVLLISREL